MAVTTEAPPSSFPHRLDAVQLTVTEAAQVYGVHSKTIRRRIKRGELQAQKVKTPQGYEWEVTVQQDDMPPEETAIVRSEPVQAALESLSSIMDNRLDAVQEAAHADAQAQLLAIEQGFAAVVEELRLQRRSDHKRRPWWRVWERSEGGSSSGN